MKKLALLLFAAGAAFSTTWYEISVPLKDDALPAALSEFDITRIKPGFEAELVVTGEELKLLGEAGIEYRIVTEDLESYYASLMQGEGPLGDYYSYDEVNAILDSLHERYPEVISERTALPNDDFHDTTWFGNSVWAVKISDNVDIEEDEPEVLYTGVHHAREPVGATVCVEWARWLCENYGTDPVATYLVDNREIWIIPIVNPDGYLYNEEIAPGGGGMHRKNRRPTGGPNPGVDLNRNYPYMWGYDNQGSSPDSSRETYRGPAPASEPETQSVINLCKEHEFVTALNFHSYSNLFIYPWGYQSVQCEDSSAYFSWGEISTRTCHYVVFPGFELYSTNGDADDWMYGETTGKNRIFAVTPEVGERFWQEWQIDQHVKETRPLLIATAKAASRYPELEGIRFSDGGDGEISPSETVDLFVWIHNMSVRDSSGVIDLELGGGDPRVQFVKPDASIPSLAPQTTGSNEADPLRVKLTDAAQPDSAIALTLKITTADEEFIYDILLPVGRRDTLIADDFEGASSTGWSTNWGETDEAAHSGNHSITDSPYTGYADGSFYHLTSPRFDLSGRVAAELSFWHRFSIEKNFYDWAAVEVSSDRTDGWVTLKRYCGNQDDWSMERFDLSEFCGAADFQVRFTLTSDKYEHLDGWYVDDVVLTAFSGAPSNYGGLYELAEVRLRPAPAQSITSGTLRFIGPADEHVEVTVFDAAGREAAATRGTLPFTWLMQDDRGRPLAPGVYFVKTASPRSETNRKVVLTR